MTIKPIFYEQGDKYIVRNGCPKCGSDLEVSHRIAEVCVNFQHSHCPEMYSKGGNRTCDHALMGG